MRYIIFDTESEAKQLSEDLWNMVSNKNNTTGLMFSYRSNVDKSKWALMVDPTYTSQIKIDKKVKSFNTNHGTNINKGKLNIHSILNQKFTLVNPKKLDQIEWGLESAEDEIKRLGKQ